jgi:hypothetical protein
MRPLILDIPSKLNDRVGWLGPLSAAIADKLPPAAGGV